MDVFLERLNEVCPDEDGNRARAVGQFFNTKSDFDIVCHYGWHHGMRYGYHIEGYGDVVVPPTKPKIRLNNFSRFLCIAADYC